MKVVWQLCLLMLLSLSAFFTQAQSPQARFEQRAQISSEIDTLQDVARKWPLEVYQPWDASRAQMQQKRMRGVRKKYENRFPESPEELNEVIDALGPFLRYLYLFDLYYSSHAAVVAPGGVTSLEIDSYCLDAGLPSPPANEPLKLVRNHELFPPPVLPIYRSLMRYHATHNSNSIQGLLWTLRSIDDGNATLERLSRSDAELLERVHPGALETLSRTYRLDGLLPRMGGRPVRNLEGFVNGLVEQQMGAALRRQGVAWSPGDSVEDTLSRMAGLEAEGRMDPANAYTELAPGVIARGINIQGHSRFGVDIVNTSANPYVFNTTDYIAQPSRRAQRLAPGRSHNVLTPTPRDEAGRKEAIGTLRDLGNGNFANGKSSQKKQCSLKTLDPNLTAEDILSVYDAVPIVSEILSLASLVTGKNMLTGEPLSWSEYTVALINVATIGAGPVKAAVKGTKLIARVAEAVKKIAKPVGKNRVLTDASSLEDCIWSHFRPNEPPPPNPTLLWRGINRIADDPGQSYCRGTTASANRANSRKAYRASQNDFARDFQAAYCAQSPALP